ncbi:helix-turn-helix domain-containing protein [Pseudoalteromonas sp. C2R02]|nr:helix-turn-helix domain-containing protein [Pseudoalteromonas sp. C2R02]
MKNKNLREKHCWSQEELASISGLSIRTIQRVEKTGSSSLETMKALASVFKVDPLSLSNQTPIQNITFSFISKFGWTLFY